jgi:excisionase family DNA binding protein
MIAISERVYLSMFKGEPEGLTVPEAAKLLRIGINQTYRLARNSQLGSIRVTNKVLVPKLSVVAFLVENNPCRFVSFDARLSPSECDIVCTADGGTGENHAKGERK